MLSLLYGERIRSLRKAKKLTMKQFGERFNLAESTISGYENETRKPDIDIINKFSDFFEVNSDYLLGRSDDSSPTQKKSTGGRAFLGGAGSYTEEELEIANAAAAAAIEALRKSRAKKNNNN